MIHQFKPKTELKKRSISAAILAAAVLFITWYSADYFTLLCAAGAIILMSEWRTITRGRSRWFLLIGAVYILSACSGLIYLRVENLNILFAVFAIVWTGDIAAYFAGRKWGHHKIAPKISPGKSWEGLVGSIVASAGMAALISYFANVPPIPHAILGALFAVLGLAGDMFESALKRRAGVKDSGKLIPGHGGLFDRVDALLPCAIFAAAALYIRLALQ